MASIAASGSAEAYYAQNRAVINQMFNIAQNVVDKYNHELGAMTGGSIKNNSTGHRIRFLNKYDWSGTNKEVYPRFIAKGQFGTFIHGSSYYGGHSDEAAVVYTNECGSALLLAWSVKDQRGGFGNSNKVHVETGPIDNYMGIDWYAIKSKLDASRDTSYCMDEYNKSEAFAKISPGTKAALVAICSMFNKPTQSSSSEGGGSSSYAPLGVAQLHERLQATQYELQTTQSRLQSTEEELQATKEELNATRRQLQEQTEALVSLNVRFESLSRLLGHPGSCSDPWNPF